MLITRTILAMLLTAFTVTGMSMDSFAYYHVQSGAVSNAYNLSPVLYISFNPGSGSGSMPEASLVLDDKAVLPANQFTKTGYHFAGWSLGTDGSVLSDARDLLNKSNGSTRLTLYASWSANSYTVSFEDNIVGGAVPKALSCTYDKAASLPSYNAAQDDMLFIGWSTDADGAGTILSPSSSIYNLSAVDGGRITLYAQWDDESAGLIEPNWNRQLDTDSNNNGTPDRLELKSNSKIIKDPSVKNLTDKACYAYIAVAIPAVSARLSGEASASVHDIAVLNTTSHWKLVKSKVSSSASAKSLYIYRYDTVLKAHGSSELSPNHTLRHADRSTDLMSSFSIQNFTSCPAVSNSIDVRAVLIEAIVTESEADTLAISKLIGS